MSLHSEGWFCRFAGLSALVLVFAANARAEGCVPKSGSAATRAATR